ncbi:hypothetical protein Nepgr_004050 [Nepenthes gracilis]|uniref:Uncharacterized protein n=1 Tax=Nepenthes gracilis TaxID=150966 RepID=A0AAD3S0Y8_NEPGR|nr:hypothetical protein Nepgr_004050 [Nepenthes gracilis]
MSCLDASKEKKVTICDGLVERSSSGNMMIPHPPLCEAISAIEEPCHCPCAGDVLVPSGGEVPTQVVPAEEGSWGQTMPRLPEGQSSQVPIVREDDLLDSGIENHLIDTGHDSGIESVQTPNCPSLAHADQNSLASARLMAPSDACGHSGDPIPSFTIWWKRVGCKVDWFLCVVLDCIPNAMWNDADFCTEKLLWEICLLWMNPGSIHVVVGSWIPLDGL